MARNSGIAELAVIEVDPDPNRKAQDAARVRAWKQANPDCYRRYYRNAHPRTCAEPECEVDITGTGVLRCRPHVAAREAELSRQRRQPKPRTYRAHPPTRADWTLMAGDEVEVELIPVETEPRPRKRTGASSVYWGVSWDNSRCKWMASAGKTTVGRYDDEAEAARARDARVIELGLAVPINFPDEPEN